MAAWWPGVAGLLLVLPSASSMAWKLDGNVYPSGHYNVTMSIGDPEKPYSLDFDTGSDLTWLQCDAPCKSCHKVPHPHPLYRPGKNSFVPCAHPLCTALHSELGYNQQCPSPERCDYRIKYIDGTSSTGVLVKDNFSIPLGSSSNVRPSLVFGCGYDQHLGKNGAAGAATDGMLGLGRGSISLLSQLKNIGVTKNVLGHCLSTSGGGFLFFGDDMVPASRVTWVPMVHSTSGNYYSAGLATLYLDRHPLGAKPMEIVFDSGSTYTYFTAQPYHAVVSALTGGLSKSLRRVSDPSLPLCWRGQRAFRSVSDVTKEFRSSLLLSFAGGSRNAVMEIPPENYLIVTIHGNVCLGILDATVVSRLSFNVIGDISMQDQVVIYDNEEARLGWARQSCAGTSAKSTPFLP